MLILQDQTSDISSLEKLIITTNIMKDKLENFLFELGNSLVLYDKSLLSSLKDLAESLLKLICRRGNNSIMIS